MHIKYSSELSKFGADVRVRSIADQICVLLYGKRYGNSIYGALGKKQSILMKKNKLRGKEYVIHVDDAFKDLPQEKSKKSSSVNTITDTRDISKIMVDIQSMVKHGVSEGLDMKIV